MSKLACISLLAALASVPAIAETAIPDMKGTWTGESESIVLGRGNQHHRAKAAAATVEPRLSSVKFTMVIDKQDSSHAAAPSGREMEMLVEPGAETSRSDPWARSTRSLSDRGWMIVLPLAAGKPQPLSATSSCR